MTHSVSHAYYDTHDDAARAIADLRSAGATDEHISVIGRQDGEIVETDASGEAVEATKDIVGKAAAGAGVGALLGVAALAIPGVGPFVAAGAIAEAAIGGAAVAGTAAGALTGGLVGALQDHGIDEDNARFYNERLESGNGTLVTVNRPDTHAERYDDILYNAGGYNSVRRRALAA